MLPRHTPAARRVPSTFPHEPNPAFGGSWAAKGTTSLSPLRCRSARRDVLPRVLQAVSKALHRSRLSLKAPARSGSGLTESTIICLVSETVVRVGRRGPAGAPTRARSDAIPNEGRASQPPEFHAGRHRARSATSRRRGPSATHMEPFDSYDPIVHLDWQTRAACRGMGSDLFFPTGGNAIAHATRICARCPVLEECRTTALDDPSLYGVWAGTSVGGASSSAK